MAFIKKEWKNRLVEFAGRRKLTRVAGSIDNQIIVDVTREEGAVSQQGDAFSEANMNDLEQRIEDGFNDTIDKNNILDKEGVEANTEAGKYVADAMVVKEVIDSLEFPDGTQFYADMQDGKPGFNTDPERGADTFVPFRYNYNSFVSILDRSYILTDSYEQIRIISLFKSGSANAATGYSGNGKISYSYNDQRNYISIKEIQNVSKGDTISFGGGTPSFENYMLIFQK